MADYTITSPRLQVLRGSLDAPEVLEVQTLNPDLILWDRTRAKHKWPDIQSAPFLWLTFLAWAACRREGRIPRDLTWDEWEATTLNVANLNADDDDDAADPTRPGPGPG
jgi:hypothetical protein